MTFIRWSWPTWSFGSLGLPGQDSAGQCQAVGSMQAGGWGPRGRNTEAGCMWQCGQVVGVGGEEAWLRGWGRAQEEQGGRELAPWGTSSSWEGHLGRAWEREAPMSWGE